MKFALLFISNTSLDADVDEETNEQLYKEIFAWFDTYGAQGMLAGGAELQGVATAVTVGSGGTVTPGGFFDTTDQLGGYTLVEVPDQATALEMAKAWPSLKLPGHAVEVRPVVDHG
jgi:hypothetical protein